jgi:hypothetical protein
MAQQTPPPSSNNQTKCAGSVVMFSATYKFNCTAGMSSPHHSTPPFISQAASTSDLHLRDRQSFSEFSHPDELPRCTLDSFCDSFSCQQHEPEPYYGFYHEVDHSNHIIDGHGCDRSDTDDASSAEKRHSVSISPSSTCFPVQIFNYVSKFSLLLLYFLSSAISDIYTHIIACRWLNHGPVSIKLHVLYVYM